MRTCSQDLSTCIAWIMKNTYQGHWHWKECTPSTLFASQRFSCSQIHPPPLSFQNQDQSWVTDIDITYTLQICIHSCTFMDLFICGTLIEGQCKLWTCYCFLYKYNTVQCDKYILSHFVISFWICRSHLNIVWKSITPCLSVMVYIISMLSHFSSEL